MCARSRGALGVRVAAAARATGIVLPDSQSFPFFIAPPVMKAIIPSTCSIIYLYGPSSASVRSNQTESLLPQFARPL